MWLVLTGDFHFWAINYKDLDYVGIGFVDDSMLDYITFKLGEWK